MTFRNLEKTKNKELISHICINSKIRKMTDFYKIIISKLYGKEKGRKRGICHK